MVTHFPESPSRARIWESFRKSASLASCVTASPPKRLCGLAVAPAVSCLPIRRLHMIEQRGDSVVITGRPLLGEVYRAVQLGIAHRRANGVPSRRSASS